VDPKARAIIREWKQHLAQMRQRGQLKRQLARLRLTTAELAEMVIRKGRRP
jgi:hypothetical protein